jgi:polyribonucleotide nucleotidyltransferase
MERIVFGKEQIGALIGPGGKSIQEIQATTGTVVVVQEEGAFGIALVSGPNKEAIDAAVLKIKGKVEVPEAGKVYQGKVKSILEFGAFVEILPGKEGLLHISEIDTKRVQKVTDVLKEGDIVEVKIIEIDSKTGKMRLSRKALMK